MISFGNLSIEGFGSILQPFTISLESKTIIVIRGRTGTGKTTILSALAWVLYGVNIKEVSEVNTWPKYRPKDYQGTMVSIYFKVDNKIYKIIRCQNYKGLIEGVKGKDNLFFYEDGVLSKTKGKKNIQKEIEETLKISYRVFINSVLFGQGLKRLINETNSDQKALFEEIFDLAYTSQAKTIANEMFKVEKSILDTLLDKKSVLEASLEAYTHNYKLSKRESKEFEESQRVELEKLNKKVDEYKKILSELKLTFNPNMITALKKKINSLDIKLKNVKKDYEECLNLNSIPLSQLIEEVITLLENKKYDTCIGNLHKIKGSLEKAQRLESQKYKLIEKISVKKSKLNKLDGMSREVLHYDKLIGIVKSDIFEVKCRKPSKAKTELKSKIIEIKKSLENLLSEIEPQQKKVEDIKWVIEDPLSNHGIKAYLFESSITSLNKILDSYSDVLELNIQYKIDTSTKKKDFTTIIRFEGQTVLYEELSGGQKQLVHLAMAFAMNQLVTAEVGLNIAFLDEIFENLSEDKIDIVVNLIKYIYRDKSLFIITHQDTLPIPGSKTLYTKRNKGLSTFNF